MSSLSSFSSSSSSSSFNIKTTSKTSKVIKIETKVESKSKTKTKTDKNKNSNKNKSKKNKKDQNETDNEAEFETKKQIDNIFLNKNKKIKSSNSQPLVSIQELELLTEFDYDPKYGPMLAIARSRRFKRAINLNVNPPPSPVIREILERFDCFENDNFLLEINQCVLQHRY